MVTVVVVAEVLEEAAEAVTVEVVVAVLGEAAAVVEALEAVMEAAVVSDPAGTRFSPTTRSTSPAFPPTSQKMISHR